MTSEEDLLCCARPRTERRAPMPMKNRAAQFAPFAALTGYDDAVRETERLTDRRPEISEDRAEILDRRLRWLRDHPDEAREITVTWFVPDVQKEGGACRTRIGLAKRVDTHHKTLLLQDGECIPISEICELQISQADV
ncbi:MAG: hypothetical protein IJH52_05290 [Oscillospiraceae bacterium]|nr:hypothetical protein [Oscillospiraceae bacterium]MBQ6402805.1 hypothetical protein [Oscillospiraceae bacterium]